MKKFLLYLLLAYAALSLQSVVFKGVKPDFVLVLVCIYALKYDHPKGVAFGAVSGLIIDSAGGYVLGPNLISKTFAAFFARTLRDNIFNWNIVANTLLVAILSLADNLIVYLCHKFFSGVNFENRPWNISLLEILFTTISSVILYGFFNPGKEEAATENS